MGDSEALPRIEEQVGSVAVAGSKAEVASMAAGLMVAALTVVVPAAEVPTAEAIGN